MTEYNGLVSCAVCGETKNLFKRVSLHKSYWVCSEHLLNEQDFHAQPKKEETEE